MIIVAEADLKEEFEFYKSNQKSLVEKYKGKFVVIKNQKIVGVYNTEIEAYQSAQKDHRIGSFLIQRVEEGENNYTQTFYSRVAL